MSVYRTPKSRFWQYDFVRQGRRFHGSTGVETRRKAEEVERRIRNDVATGAIDQDEGPDLDHAAGQWWTEVGQHRASARQLKHRLAIVVRLIGPKTKMHSITTRTVAIAIEKRRAEVYARGKDRPAEDGKPAKIATRRGLANATVNCDVVKPLRRVWNRCRKTWGVAGLPEIDWQTLMLPEPEPEILHFADDYQRAWLDACGPTERFGLELLLTYGLRFAEIFFKPAAYLPDMPGGAALAINKRKRGALLVPLREGHARQIAARIGVAQAADMDSIWLERDDKGEVVQITYAAMQSRLRTAAERAGVTHKRLIHSTRHHVGTDALAQTGDIRLVQELLGHRDIKSTLVYAHALKQGVRAAINSRNSPGADSDATEFVVPIQHRKRP